MSVCQAAASTTVGNGACVWVSARLRAPGGREQPHSEPFGEREWLIVRRALITGEC